MRGILHEVTTANWLESNAQVDRLIRALVEGVWKLLIDGTDHAEKRLWAEAVNTA